MWNPSTYASSVTRQNDSPDGPNWLNASGVTVIIIRAVPSPGCRILTMGWTGSPPSPPRVLVGSAEERPQVLAVLAHLDLLHDGHPHPMTRPTSGVRSAGGLWRGGGFTQLSPTARRAVCLASPGARRPWHRR